MGGSLAATVAIANYDGMNVLLFLTQSFLVLLPFQVALSPYPGVDLPFSRAFAPILFLLFLSVSLIRRRLHIPWSRIAIFLAIYLSITFLSVLWAENTVWAVRRVLFLLSFFPLFPLFSGLRQEGVSGDRLVRPFVVGAAVAAFVAIAEWCSQYIFGVSRLFDFWTGAVLPVFLGPSFSDAVARYPSLLANIGGSTVLRASAFFPDPHIAAFYFGMALPLSCSYAFSERRLARKVMYAVFSGMLLIADLLTFSRGGYIGLVVGSGVFLSTRIGSVRFRPKTVLILFSFATVFVSVLFLLPQVRDRFVSAFSSSDGSNNARMSLYAESLGHIRRNPFGYGPGNYPLVVKPTAEYREPIYVHDLPLDIATESGILGASVFLLAIFSAIRETKRSASGPMFAISVSLAVFSGHALFEMPLYSVHILPVLLLLLSMADRQEVGQREKHPGII